LAVNIGIETKNLGTVNHIPDKKAKISDLTAQGIAPEALKRVVTIPKAILLWNQAMILWNQAMIQWNQVMIQ
jgi:hypothetical protein